MRILVYHYYDLSRPGGGAEAVVSEQVDTLHKMGHDAKLVSSNIEWGVKDFRPDAVHFHTFHVVEGLRPLKWVLRHGIPCVISFHDYWPFCGQRALLLDDGSDCPAVEGKCDTSCPYAQVLDIVNEATTVTFNPYSAEIFERNGIHIDKVIPHGISDFWTPYGEKERGRIVTSSAWPNNPMKGMKYLDAAARELGRSIRLLTGLDKLRLRAELRKADIYVLPSIYQETFSLALTEALACGCYCIASDVAGPRWQAEQSLSIDLVPPRDSIALAATIESALDDNIREMFDFTDIRDARESFLADRSLERCYRQYVELYESL